MAEAYRVHRAAPPGEDGVAARLIARQRLRDAHEAAPDWPAPLRFADEIGARPLLMLPGAYGRHLDTAYGSASPEVRAAAFYLAGRLGGAKADERFRKAVELDPTLSWARHGQAWRLSRAGNRKGALELGALALSLARDPYEVVHFASAAAQYATGSGDQRLYRRAIELISPALHPDAPFPLEPALRAEVEVDLALLEIGAGVSELQRRGAQRAARLLAEDGVTVGERLELAAELLDSQEVFVPREQVIHGLMTARDRATTASERDRVETLIASAVGDAAEDEGPGVDRLRGAWRPRLERAFADGTGPEVFDRWVRELPAAVLDADGRPRRPALARLGDALAEASRTDVDGRAEIEAVGDALVGAGWFQEAFALARRARRLGHPGASLLEGKASAGRTALARVSNMARRIDLEMAFERGGAVGVDGVTSAEGKQIDSLRRLDREVRRIVEGTLELEEPAARSPKIRYGPLGAVLHPGPEFSREDERVGRGRAGEPVPGIAALFRSLGRFALLGQGVGQGGPDAAVLRLVHDEWREGEHLGRPFRGRVFWCEGADVPGRFARRGASISGAALHEGYFVDLAQVQREKRQWEAALERIEVPDHGAWSVYEEILGMPGAAVPPGLRAESTPALGAADRMRLAVMLDLLRPEDDEPRVPSLGDFAHVVETHEEGHLCDRAMWYPISAGGILQLISFAGAHGFSQARLARALEARAQLVAIACVRDPRIAMVDLLDAAESERGGGITPHAEAYRGLLDALLERMDREVERGEWEGRGIDPARRLIDQLHRVAPEDLRGLAVREARARGLTRG